MSKPDNENVHQNVRPLNANDINGAWRSLYEKRSEWVEKKVLNCIGRRSPRRANGQTGQPVWKLSEESPCIGKMLPYTGKIVEVASFTEFGRSSGRARFVVE